MKARQQKVTWVDYVMFFAVLIGIGVLAGMVWRVWVMITESAVF